MSSKHLGRSYADNIAAGAAVTIIIIGVAKIMYPDPANLQQAVRIQTSNLISLPAPQSTSASTPSPPLRYYNGSPTVDAPVVNGSVLILMSLVNAKVNDSDLRLPKPMLHRVGSCTIFPISAEIESREDQIAGNCTQRLGKCS